MQRTSKFLSKVVLQNQTANQILVMCCLIDVFGRQLPSTTCTEALASQDQEFQVLDIGSTANYNAIICVAGTHVGYTCPNTIIA